METVSVTVSLERYIPHIVFVAAIVLFSVLRGFSRSKTITLSNPLVIDGDTIFCDGIKYRLHGIDAPEMEQPGGVQAKRQLSLFVTGRDVQAEIMDVDRYKRKVARLYTHEGDICKLMVENGYAIAAFHKDYIKDELTSRSKKRGLWGQGGIHSPLLWRKQNSGSK